MKISLRQISLAALVAVGLAYNANATPVALTPSTLPLFASGNDSSNSTINNIIAGLIGNSTELYKQNQGGTEVGSFAGSYTTTFTANPNNASNFNDGKVVYDGAPNPIIDPTAYFLVKDGNSTPNWYLFNLTALGWTGTEDITFSGFFLGSGPNGNDQSISHVTIYSAGSSVPDGGSTVALLGGALILLAGITRRGFTLGLL